MSFPLAIQMPPDAVNDVIHLAAEMTEPELRVGAGYTYDPKGSWLTFRDSRQLASFLGFLKDYSEYPEGENVDPEGIAHARAMHAYITARVLP